MLKIDLGANPLTAKITDMHGNDLSKAVAIADLHIRANGRGLANADIYIDSISGMFEHNNVRCFMKHPRTGEPMEVAEIKWKDGTTLRLVPEIKVVES